MTFFASRQSRLFLGVFLFALVIGLAFQQLFLPTIMPHLHAGSGLIIGGDWVIFHHVASELALRIEAEGWSAWELRPQSHAPSGIAAAIYALTGIHSPAFVLPLNALLFSIAACELFRLLARLTSARWAYWGIIPFVLFPSSLLVYGQLHKDVFSIAGLLLVFGTLLFDDSLRRFRGIALLLLRMGVGLLLIWIVRPYMLQIVVLAWWAGAVLICGLVLLRAHVPARRLFLFLCAIIAVQIVVLRVLSVELPQVPPPVSEGQSVVVTEGWLSGRILSLIRGIDTNRRNFALSHGDAGTLIDADVRFNGVFDLMAYTPRALQVGYLAPFPMQSFSASSNAGGNLMRSIAGIEMLLAYLAFALGLLALGRSRSDAFIRTAAVLAACTVVILIFAYSLPNVGTLYRMRLAPWHIAIGFGIAAGAQALAAIWRARLRPG